MPKTWLQAAVVAGVMLAGSGRAFADEVLFEDNFKSGLGPGWSWIREVPEAWRVRDGALELRLLPGNLWGAANTGRNLLVRPAPDPARGPVRITVTFANIPTRQYEQVDLAWYYDDSHMVKLGREQVNGPVCVVMGREEQDRCRTIAKPPVRGDAYQLRLTVDHDRIRGEYRLSDEAAWTPVGECTLPRPAAPEAKPRISIHTYNGPPDREHWARVSGFKVERLSR